MSPWARLTFAVNAIVVMCILSAAASPAHATPASPEPGASNEITYVTSADLESPLDAGRRLELADQEDGESPCEVGNLTAVPASGLSDPASPERTRPVRLDRPPRIDRIG
jgi:hypothetical protein